MYVACLMVNRCCIHGWTSVLYYREEDCLAGAALYIDKYRLIN